MMILDIRTAQAEDDRHVVGTLVRAFEHDPAVRWMYPDRQDFLEHFPAFVRGFGGRAFDCGTVHCTSAFQAVSLWLPPGVHPDDEALVDLISRTVPEANQGALNSLFEQMGEYHPDEPHWHLPLIGVDPQEQGVGHGSALLRHALARCDAEGTSAYLESSNVRNIPLYLRHGFEVLGTIQVGSSPPVTPMLRRPLCCRLIAPDETRFDVSGGGGTASCF